MYIQSEIGKLARYSENAIEAFRIAVDNGQARLAMQILVDVIDRYAEKFDEYDALIEEKFNSLTPTNIEPVKEVEIEKEEVKLVQEPTPQPKAKPVQSQKEVSTDK
jgi:hypothetical protein